MQCFLEYDWPGNVRELENTIERLVVTSRDDCINQEVFAAIQLPSDHPMKQNSSSLKASVEREEKRLITEAYLQAGNTRRAATLLGISQSCMVKKMKKYMICNSSEKGL